MRFKELFFVFVYVIYLFIYLLLYTRKILFAFSRNIDKASQSWIGGLGGRGRISHCFHFEFTLSSHWISQRVHFDFTFDLKGKGKASRAEREKGKGLDDLGLVPTRQWTPRVRTHERNEQISR